MAKKTATTKKTTAPGGSGRTKKSVRPKPAKSGGSSRGASVKKKSIKARSPRNQTRIAGTGDPTFKDIDAKVRAWKKEDERYQKTRKTQQAKIDAAKAKADAKKASCVEAMHKRNVETYELGHMEEFPGQYLELASLAEQLRLKKHKQGD